jgi:hypothetical protein
VIDMKVLIQNGVVVAVSEEARIVPGGVYIGNNTVFADQNVTILDVPDLPAYVKPLEYKYIEGQGFIRNPDYVPPASLEDQLKDAKAQIGSLERIIKRMNDDQLAFMEDVLTMMQ